MLTDTTFWIDLAAERETGGAGPAHHFLAVNRSKPFAISIVTWAELAVGFDRSQPLEQSLAGCVSSHSQDRWLGKQAG